MIISFRISCIDVHVRYDWLGTAINSTEKNFTVPALNNSLVYEGLGLASIIPEGHNASDVWLLLNLTAEVGNETVTNEQYVRTCCISQP